MKKLISLTLAFCMCFALFACGQKAEPAPAASSEPAAAEAEAAEPAAEPAAEAAPADGETVLKNAAREPEQSTL